MPTALNTAGRRPRSIWRFLRDVLVIFLAALVLSFLVKTYLVRSFYIPSGSMEHTLEINDRVIVNELVPGLVSLHRGDVVVFADPGGWLSPLEAATPATGPVDKVLSTIGLAPHDGTGYLIKRVIGLPGDTVTCCDDFGHMSVNGVPLDEPYITVLPDETRASRDDFTVTVPDGSLWVMGDNRYNSRDSRYNRDKPGEGFVPLSDVAGRAAVISWPSSRWTWLDNYPTVFAGTDPRSITN
ncbi:signal peptidase I [Frigoribacterium sp. CFBP 8766]|uniref:signal peptidase I n=1 Tax=Frigoribacterium sp. CFBP 8766 TaxID=2775273 RepID=UPI00177BACAA|nr:signal peptidase I [Frigoribacterium sp. CFBP 8766]MBD8585959.1 signal peptidase I [Frigoribacterium sp. CFBP 8766]